MPARPTGRIPTPRRTTKGHRCESSGADVLAIPGPFAQRRQRGLSSPGRARERLADVPSSLEARIGSGSRRHLLRTRRRDTREPWPSGASRASWPSSYPGVYDYDQWTETLRTSGNPRHRLRDRFGREFGRALPRLRGGVEYPCVDARNRTGPLPDRPPRNRDRRWTSPRRRSTRRRNHRSRVRGTRPGGGCDREPGTPRSAARTHCCSSAPVLSLSPAQSRPDRTWMPHRSCVFEHAPDLARC